MTTRRQALSIGLGITAMTLAPRAGAAAAARQGGALAKKRLRIFSLEEHVHDPDVAIAVKDAFAAEVPYMAGLGSRHRDNPALEPADRPRLTFIPDSIRTAAAPVAARIAAMDAAGIDRQIISLSNEPQLAPQPVALDVAQRANDRLAAMVARYPDRLTAFFTLPWQDPQAAAREAERCVRELKLPATMLTGRPHADGFLDDMRYDPVLATLARLDAPLYLHPGPPLHAVRKSYYDGFNADLTARLTLFGWGWHNEAGVQVVRLILSGALDRHRKLKLISGHWGEMVPFFLQRMDDTMPRQVTGLTRTITQSYRDQIWVGPSGMLQTPHFMFLREVLGIERLVFSIDYPYLTMNGARSWLETLPIRHAEKQRFAAGNAEALLKWPSGAA